MDKTSAEMTPNQWVVPLIQEMLVWWIVIILLYVFAFGLLWWRGRGRK